MLHASLWLHALLVQSLLVFCLQRKAVRLQFIQAALPRWKAMESGKHFALGVRISYAYIHVRLNLHGVRQIYVKVSVQKVPYGSKFDFCGFCYPNCKLIV